MKKIRYTFLAITALVVASSCSNFADLNTNPDTATKVPSSMIASQVMKDTYRFFNPNASDFMNSNLWNKHVAYAGPDTYNAQYYSSYPGDFGSFKRLTDLKAMVNFSAGTPQESSYKGLALFMKATYGFQMTTDMGDIPYSEAGKADEGIIRPKYDKQADVFVEILADLKEAEADFAQGVDFDGDLMYAGSAKKWQKLCNAMQLKVLQTMSKHITAEQKTRFAEIVAANNLMTGNDDNFQLVYTGNSNARHPFWNGVDFRNHTPVSKLMIDNLKALKDRRLFYFADPAPALIAAGKLENDYNAYEGAYTAENNTVLNVNAKNGMYSLVNTRYTVFEAGDPMLRFTYAEQCFIIAEAIEEGWVSGNAQTYYENGVKAILSYYMTLPSTIGYTHGMPIDQNYIDNYFTGAAAYATSGTKTDRLHQIWMQRWFLDFFQGNGGNYAQFLRTGYPVYPIDPATSKNVDNPSAYPTRLKYSESEQTTNPQNYLDAVQSQYGGYDGVNGIPWYLK